MATHSVGDVSLKPNFLVIGAAKAATTALCHFLLRHRQICFARLKEPFFFSNDQVYARGWKWYRSLYEHHAGEPAVGEGSTHYSATGVFPNTVPRIAEHLPEAKLIYIVREPLSRLQSMWIEHRSQGLERRPFNEAIRDDPIYLDTAMYWKQLSAYRDHFPDERFLLLFYEDYAADANAVLQRCYRFLGVDDSVRYDDADQPRYASSDKREDLAMTNLLRRGVPGFYALRDRVPGKWRSWAKRKLKKPVEGRPEWDPATRAWVIERIGDDVRRYLEHCGKPADHWPTLERTPA